MKKKQKEQAKPQKTRQKIYREDTFGFCSFCSQRAALEIESMKQVYPYTTRYYKVCTKHGKKYQKDQ